MMGIASGGEVTFRATNEVILRSTLLGIDAKARSLSFRPPEAELVRRRRWRTSSRVNSSSPLTSHGI